MVKLTKFELERKKIIETITQLDWDENIMLIDLIKEHGDDIAIHVDYDWYYGELEINIKLNRVRLETDHEYNARIETLKQRRRSRSMAAKKAARQRALKKEQEERELYEQLKAKFEGQDK